MVGIDVTLRSVTLTAIILSSDDHFAQSATPVSTTTQTPITDALELTFTPVSEGDYLVISMCKNISGQTTASCLIRLLANGAADGVVGQRLHNTDDGVTWSHAQVYPSLSGSQSFKIQFRTLTGGTNVTIDEQFIVALRVSDLDNYYDDEEQGLAQTTSSTFQNRASVTFTPAATEHLLIGSATTRRTGGTGAQEIQSILDEDTTIQIKKSTVTSQATQQDHDYFAMVKRAMNPVVDTVWKTQWRSPDGSSNIQIKRNNVTVLDVHQDGTLRWRGGRIKGGRWK